jgi:hypothetical protein
MEAPLYIMDENPACKSTRVTFGITGMNVQPDLITKRFRIKPTRAFAAREPYKSKVGERVRGFGQWAVESARLVQSRSTEKHALAVLTVLEPRKAVILRYIKETKDRVYFSIRREASDGHGGFTLTSATIKRLINLCPEIHFHFVS